MDLLKDWAFSVCCAVLIGGIFNIMLPDGSLKKTFKTILSVFFIYIVISPFIRINFSDIKQNFEYSSAEKEFDNNIFYEDSLDYIENEIYSSTSYFLEKNGIKDKDIFIEVNISENSGIDINKFVLKIKKEDYTESLEEEIHKEIGIMPEIVFSED